MNGDDSISNKRSINKASIELASDKLRTPKLSTKKRRRRCSVPTSLLIQTPNRVNLIRRKPNSSVSSDCEIISDRGGGGSGE